MPTLWKSAVICSGVPGGLRSGGGNGASLSGNAEFGNHTLEATRQVEVEKSGFSRIDSETVNAMGRDISESSGLRMEPRPLQSS